MVRSILVPLDGSSSAEDVLQAAGALAGAVGARLLLVRPVSARSGPAGATPACRAAQAHAYLQRCAQDVHARFPFLHVGVSAPYGPWPDAVLDEASLAGVDLIVADRRLAGDHRVVLRDQALGDAALALSRRADVPVLLMPPGVLAVELAAANGGRLEVLIPLDGSPSAEAILPVIVSLGTRLPLNATVLHVVTTPDASREPSPAGAVETVDTTTVAAQHAGSWRLNWATAAAYCQRAANWLERYGVPARVEVRAGAAIEEIGRTALDIAEASGGVLALGLPEALPWRFGYSAEPLLRAVRLPVLQIRSRRSEPIVPPDGASGTAAGDDGLLASVAGEWDHRAHASAAPGRRL